jgi:hypothetical protein
MAKKFLRRSAFIGLLFYLPFHSMGWGMLGHRIVGEIAERYLTPEARKAVTQILGTESVAMASNWADFIKSDSTFNYLSPWHYLNIKDGLNYTEFRDYLKKDTVADANTKLNFLVKELKNKKLPKDKKIMYLRLLIHIVGDIHQPMHVSRAEDQGGNRIRVMWFNEPSNLHRVWDDQLIEYQKLSYTEYVKAIDHTNAKQNLAWQKQPISQWFFDSYEISHNLYNEIRNPDEKLSYRYNFDHVQILNEQLLKGGIRLAGLLNDIFGK